MLYWIALIFCIFSILPIGFTGHKCVWIRGSVKCVKDPSKQLNVEVRVYDRDGLSIAQVVDPDDLMGVTFTTEDGKFELDGCGDDFDWIPGIPNNPEPYMQIFHYCNSAKGDTITLPTFHVFVPETYEPDVIELDTVSSSIPSNFTDFFS